MKITKLLTLGQFVKALREENKNNCLPSLYSSKEELYCLKRIFVYSEFLESPVTIEILSKLGFEYSYSRVGNSSLIYLNKELGLRISAIPEGRKYFFKIHSQHLGDDTEIKTVTDIAEVTEGLVSFGEKFDVCLYLNNFQNDV